MYLSDASGVSSGPDWQSVLAAITQTYANKKLIQAQTDRIRAGQQPMELPPMLPNLTPMPVPTSIVSTGRNDLLIAAGIGVLAVGAVLMLGGGRRRGRR